jgi:hypothetical protein
MGIIFRKKAAFLHIPSPTIQRNFAETLYEPQGGSLFAGREKLRGFYFSYRKKALENRQGKASVSGKNGTCGYCEFLKDLPENDKCG